MKRTVGALAVATAGGLVLLGVAAAPGASAAQQCQSHSRWIGSLSVNRIPCAKAERMVHAHIDGRVRWPIGWGTPPRSTRAKIVPLYPGAKLWPGTGKGFIRFVVGSGD